MKAHWHPKDGAAWGNGLDSRGRVCKEFEEYDVLDGNIMNSLFRKF